MHHEGEEMKYLRILIEPIRIKGCEDDEETLKVDLYEKVSAMIEAETLAFTIDEDEDSDDELDY
jgi:hypothetical protein